MDMPTRAGWYDDPENDQQLRYFDGVVWSKHTTPRSTRPAAAAAQPGQQQFPGQGHPPQYPGQVQAPGAAAGAAAGSRGHAAAGARRTASRRPVQPPRPAPQGGWRSRPAAGSRPAGSSRASRTRSSPAPAAGRLERAGLPGDAAGRDHPRRAAAGELLAARRCVRPRLADPVRHRRRPGLLLPAQGVRGLLRPVLLDDEHRRGRRAPGLHRRDGQHRRHPADLLQRWSPSWSSWPTSSSS